MTAVHPDVEALIAAGKAAGTLPFEAMAPDGGARRPMPPARDLLQLAAEAVSEQRDVTVAGPAGPIPLRLYRPAGMRAAEAVLPCLVYMHGGGWVFGNLESHDGALLPARQRGRLLRRRGRLPARAGTPLSGGRRGLRRRLRGHRRRMPRRCGSTRPGSRSAATARAATSRPCWP